MAVDDGRGRGLPDGPAVGTAVVSFVDHAGGEVDGIAGGGGASVRWGVRSRIGVGHGKWLSAVVGKCRGQVRMMAW